MALIVTASALDGHHFYSNSKFFLAETINHLLASRTSCRLETKCLQFSYMIGLELPMGIDIA